MVLARKCRPKCLGEVIGQPSVVRTLTNALTNNRLHHAYLFAGSFGCGKTTVARILAASENCLVSPGLTPCGKCDLCKKVFEGRHTDILELDAASKAGKVDQTRQLATNALYSPVDGAKKKYFIVDECLPAEAMVTLSSGDVMPIGVLVERGLAEGGDDYVRSHDFVSGKTTTHRICRYIQIPNDKQMYEVTARTEDGSLKKIRITGNHNVFLADGTKVKTQELKIGQKLHLE
jgi:hypothetical protein